MKGFRSLSVATALLLAQACSHPIEITGEGDVLSASGNRDCLLEEFLGAAENCSVNLVVDAYDETYTGAPRAGWIFDRWGNCCSDAVDNTCSFSIPAEAVHKYWGETADPLQAVFSRAKVSGPTLPGGNNIVLGTGDPVAQAYAKQEFFIEGSAISYVPDFPLPTDGKLVFTC